MKRFQLHGAIAWLGGRLGLGLARVQLKQNWEEKGEQGD